jgi:hypothetical protein
VEILRTQILSTHCESVRKPSTSRRNWNWAACLLAALAVATSLGCQTTQPHITAKVIYQQDDVAAEISSEWR